VLIISRSSHQIEVRVRHQELHNVVTQAVTIVGVIVDRSEMPTRLETPTRISDARVDRKHRPG
jgi:hypothetical protein